MSSRTPSKSRRRMSNAEGGHVHAGSSWSQGISSSGQKNVPKWPARSEDQQTEEGRYGEQKKELTHLTRYQDGSRSSEPAGLKRDTRAASGILYPTKIAEVADCEQKDQVLVVAEGETSTSATLMSTDKSGCDRGKMKVEDDSEQRENRPPPATAPAPSKSKTNHEVDEDEALVIPAWPTSLKDAAAMGSSLDPTSIQHHVYSLKDYSQVSGPNVGTQQGRSSESGPVDKSTSAKPVAGSTGNRKSIISLSSGSKAASQQDPSNYNSNNNNNNKLKHQLQQQQQQQPQAGSSGYHRPNLGRNSIINSTNHFFAESPIDRMKRLFIPSHGNTSTSFLRSAQHHLLNHQHRQQHQHHGSIFSSGASRNLVYHATKSHHLGAKGNLKSTYRVYGCPLALACNIYPITSFGSRSTDVYKQQSVPYVLTRLCNYIEENSGHLTHEGIFRVSGNARLMEKLRTLFDRLGDAPLETESVDVATSASMLKMYIRELPEPLIPTRLNGYFFALAKRYFPPHGQLTSAANANLVQQSSSSSSSQHLGAIGGLSSSNTAYGTRDSTIYTNGSHIVLNGDEQQKLKAFSRDLGKILRKLPAENYNLLRYLCCFLYRVSLKQKYNKMCPEALGIVFGPNIFRLRGQSYRDIKDQEVSNLIMASIISNYQAVFQSDLRDPLGNLVELDGVDMMSISNQHEVRWISGKVDSKTNMKPDSPTKPGTSMSSVDKSCLQPLQDSTRTNRDLDCDDEPMAVDEEVQKKLDRNEGGEGAGEVGPRIEPPRNELEGAHRGAAQRRHRSRRRACCARASCHLVSYDDAQDEQDPGEDEDSYTGSSSLTGSSYCSSDSELMSGSGSGSDLDRPLSSSDCDASSYTPSSSASPGDQHEVDSLRSSNYGDGIEDRHEGQADRSSCVVCCARMGLMSPQPEEGPSMAQETISGLEKPGTSTTENEPVQETGMKQVTDKRAFEFSARRSSSASSLGRIKRTKNHRPGTGSRSTGGGGGHRRMVAEHSMLKGGAASRARNRNQLRLSEHVPPETGNSSNLSRRGHHHRNHHKSSMRSNRLRNVDCCPKATTSHQRPRTNSSSGVAREHRKQQYHSPLGLNEPGAAGNRDLFDDSSHDGSTLDQLDQDSMLQKDTLATDGPLDLADLVEDELALGLPIRRFHSDETLYRSSNYYTEFCDLMESIVMNNESRRRFSGYDFNYAIERLNLAPQMGTCSPIGEQTFEAFEDGEPDETDDHEDLIGTTTINEPRPTCSDDQGPSIVCSLVSLLESSRLSSDAGNLAEQRTDVSTETMASLNRVSKMAEEEAHGFSLDEILADYKETCSALEQASHCIPTLLPDSLAKLKLDLLALEQAPKCWPLEDQAKVDFKSHLQDGSLSCQVDHLAARQMNIRLSYTLQQEQKEAHFRQPVPEGFGDETTCPEVDLMELRQLVDLRLKQFRRLLEHLGSLQDHFLSCHAQDRASPDRTERRMSMGSAALGCQLARDSRSLGSSTPQIESDGREETATTMKQAECHLGPICPIEFVYNIERLLANKRQLDHRNDLTLTDMNLEQLANEKLDLQKNLLRYERWFGRPLTSSNVASHLYQRYRFVKLLRLSRMMDTN